MVMAQKIQDQLAVTLENPSNVLFVGDDLSWENLRKGVPKREKEVILTDDGRNPVMELNELFHGLTYNHEDPMGPVHSASFKTTVYIEGMTYEGEGTTKKESKNRCALNALNALKASGRYAERMAEVLNKRQQNTAKKAQYMQQRAQFKNEQMAGNIPAGEKFWKYKKKTTAAAAGGEKVKNAPLPQNAVGRLNDRFRNLKYDVIQSSQDIRTRSWNFTVCLKLQGQVFLGHGNSKKGAKIACAEQCLKWLGLDVPGEPGAEQEGAEEVGVDLSQVDTSADNPITAVPLTNPVPQTSNPAPQSGQSGADTQPQKPFQSKSWNKAPGSGRGGPNNRSRGRGRGRGGPGGPGRPIRGRGGGGGFGGRGGRGGRGGGGGGGNDQYYDSYSTSGPSQYSENMDYFDPAANYNMSGYHDQYQQGGDDSYGSDPQSYGGWTPGGTLNQYPPDQQQQW